jgi:hypothetical protein
MAVNHQHIVAHPSVKGNLTDDIHASVAELLQHLNFSIFAWELKKKGNDQQLRKSKEEY